MSGTEQYPGACLSALIAIAWEEWCEFHIWRSLKVILFWGVGVGWQWDGEVVVVVGGGVCFVFIAPFKMIMT